MTTRDVERMMERQSAMEGDLREIKTQLRYIREQLSGVAARIDATDRELQTLFRWRSEMIGMYTWVRWIPPTITGIVVGVLVDLFGRT